MFKQSLRNSLVAAMLFAGSPATAATVDIVGVGDSLMAGFGLDPGQAFPEKLDVALKAKGHDVVVTGAGVSGDTTSGGRERLDWSVPDGTELVILELGANDALRGIDPAITRDNLDAMITSLKARGIDVILAGMLAPPNMGEAYAAQFNPIYPDLAQKHGVTLYPFFLNGVTGIAGTTIEDGMHPNAAGIDIMVERFLPVVEAYLAARPND